MRSGLQKSGIVPLLALLLFYLLTLVPTLAKEWDFYGYGAHFAYLGLSMPRYEGHYSSSRIKNASTETRSRLRTTSHDCEARLFDSSSSSCDDLDAEAHRPMIRKLPQSSFEAGVEPAKDFVTCYVTKEPSSITRGVSAFKEFVIRRWDDQQTAQFVAPGHESVDETSSHPTPTDAGLAVTPAAEDGQQRHLTAIGKLDAPLEVNLNPGSLLFPLPLLIHKTWQRACQAGGQYYEALTSRYPIQRYIRTLIPTSSASAQIKSGPLNLGHLQPEEPQTGQIPSEKSENLDISNSSEQPLAELKGSLSTSTLQTNTSTMTAGQSKYTGLQRDSESMRGSSMAIVIALVAGIIWF